MVTRQYDFFQHQKNVEKYKGKISNRGFIEDVLYLTFCGATGGTYHEYPIIGRKGLVCAKIGAFNIPVGELIICENGTQEKNE